MLNPRIHGIAHLRSLGKFTAEHDWRMPETGLVFGVGGFTYQVQAILPKDESQRRYRAQVVVAQLGTRRTFTEPLDKLWAGFDGHWLDGHLVRWNDSPVKKSIKRNRLKRQRAQARIRKMLVREGLIDAARVAS